jgi:hypothetical protein
LAGLSAAAGGCDRARPPPEQPPPLAVVASLPAAEDVGVPLNRPLRLRFDRFLRPDSVARQSVRVTGGTLDPKTGMPVAGNEFLEPFYDVPERAVVLRPSEGERWVPRTRYSVTLWQASANNGFGFRGVDGAELAAPVTFGFVTGDADDPAEPPPPSAVAYCGRCVDGAFLPGARDVLRPCAACHGEGPDSPLGLRLDSAASLAATALGRPAVEALTGPSVSAAQRTGPVFGLNMPRIDPGYPGTSYLLYKLLLRDDGYSPAGDLALPPSLAPPPLAGDDVVRAGIADDLRDARERFLLGRPMPPEGPAPGLERVRLLQAWIASGAPLDDDGACPSACPAGP